MRWQKIGAAIGFGLIIFIIASIFTPNNQDSTLSVILSVSTFLFGVFIAFAISDRRSRMDAIRENDSVERGYIEELYRLSSIFGKKIQKEFQIVLDKYLMATLDYPIFYYYFTEYEFKQIDKKINELDISGDKEKIAYGNIMDIMEKMGVARKKTIAHIGDTLSIFEWTIFTFLSIIIISTLLLSNSGEVYSALVVGIMSFIIALLIVFLDSLNSLQWKEEERLFEPYQRTFEAIDLMRYYPEDLLREGRITKHVGIKYRVGTYTFLNNKIIGKKISIKG
ncbi:MAG: hypothetical protein U1C71_04520 [archaeon]|nr:hypothetical protein [archaeon]